MKKLSLICYGMLFSFLTSCTSTDDVKQIQGSLLFNESGIHTFNINAENIEATITVAGSNKGETLVYESVPMYRTVEYTAKIGESSRNDKTALLNNLVVMYEAKSGKTKDLLHSNKGYIKIDWVGFD